MEEVRTMSDIPNGYTMSIGILFNQWGHTVTVDVIHQKSKTLISVPIDHNIKYQYRVITSTNIRKIPRTGSD